MCGRTAASAESREAAAAFWVWCDNVAAGKVKLTRLQRNMLALPLIVLASITSALFIRFIMYEAWPDDD